MPTLLGDFLYSAVFLVVWFVCFCYFPVFGICFQLFGLYDLITERPKAGLCSCASRTTENDAVVISVPCD